MESLITLHVSVIRYYVVQAFPGTPLHLQQAASPELPCFGLVTS